MRTNEANEAPISYMARLTPLDNDLKFQCLGEGSDFQYGKKIWTLRLLRSHEAITGAHPVSTEIRLV